MTSTLVQSKPWYKSTTLWFNGLALASVIIDWVISEGFAIVENPFFAGVVTLVNLGLRFKTEKPVRTSVQRVMVEDKD